MRLDVKSGTFSRNMIPFFGFHSFLLKYCTATSILGEMRSLGYGKRSWDIPGSPHKWLVKGDFFVSPEHTQNMYSK